MSNAPVAPDTSDSQWSAPLTGPLADEARECLRRIRIAVMKVPIDAVSDFSVATGSAGLALYHAYVNGDGSETKRMAEHLYRAHELAVAHPTRLGLFQGLAGVSWVTFHLAGERTAAVDDLLLEVSRTWTRSHEFDLISGTAGIAFYAISLPSSIESDLLLNACCRHLCERSGGEHGDAFWWKASPQYASGSTDLGVAHGVAGVIPILAAARASGRLSPSVAEAVTALLDASLDLLITSADFQSSTGVFAREIRYPGDRNRSRLAWCYGDAGIATSLLITSLVLKNRSLQSFAVDVALKCAERPWTGVVDSALCHGSAGLAHMFSRFWQMTQDARFRDLALTWYEDTIRRVSDELSMGFRNGLLTGHVGVGLALHSAVADTEPAWDEFMLCSSLVPAPTD